MLEHPYIIEKLREYQEWETKERLLRRIRNCTGRFMNRKTNFSQEQRLSGGNSELSGRIK